MIANLVRLSTLCELAGLDRRTVEHWASALGIVLLRAPVAGRGSPPKSGPLYMTYDDANRFVDATFGKLVSNLQRKRVRDALRYERRKLADSTRNLRHDVVER